MRNVENRVHKPLLLVVDDTPEIISMILDILGDEYAVKIATNGEKALKICRGDRQPDLLLLDVLMPGMSGYDVCRELAQDPLTEDIRVIFLTSRNEVEDEEYGLSLGAVDYISKPISPLILKARVRTHLNLKAASDFLHDKNSYLETEVSKRTQEVQAVQDVMILALASLAETRDSDTGAHLYRTQNYVRVLAEYLQQHAEYGPCLRKMNLDLLYKSVPLHDIGKVGIPDSILTKPGALDDNEFSIMKSHSALGFKAIQTAEKSLGSDVEFLVLAKEISRSHHEKWDGSGYPDGLKERDIPLSARLMAVADVYDALISKRVYKTEMTHSRAVEIILSGRGTHFDPVIVDAFSELTDVFLEIKNKYSD